MSKTIITYFYFESLLFEKSHLTAFFFSVNEEQCLSKKHVLCESGTKYECGGAGSRDL